MDGPVRRRTFLAVTGVVGISSLTGCIGVLENDRDIQDTDGDGVIDSEDYAPRDPEVQEKSDLVGTETSGGGNEPVRSPTSSTSNRNSARFSFEGASSGARAPPSPWRLGRTAGTHEITNQHATAGSRSFHMASYRSDLSPTEALLDVDLTRVDSVLVDAYVNAKNASYGDVKLWIDEPGNYGIRRFDGADNPENKQYRDVSLDVSEFDGTHSILLYVRGDGNDVHWDNIRLVGADGELLSRSAVLPR